MKFNGKMKKTSKHQLTVDFYTDLPSFDESKVYTFDIKERKNKRSINQNSLLWKLISELAILTDNEPMSIYISALENANAKYEWIAGLPNIENELKRNFRAVQPYGTVTTEDGKELVRYKVYIGSSKFDSSEMTKLIDYVQTQLQGV